MRKSSRKLKRIRFDAISIFPEVFEGYMGASILGRARKAKLVTFFAHDLRDWTHDRHRTVDDKPFGGGPGMVMKPQPFLEALAELKARKLKDGKRAATAKRTRVILTAANGKAFAHGDAVRLTKYERLIFLCGRYEGIDQRVADRLCDESFRIGDYVLTGGELPAMVMMDAIARQIPGVLGKEASLEEESWADVESVGARQRRARLASSKARSQKPEARSQSGSGEYPQYTRPEVWLDMKVPTVLLSGNHQKIKAWREEKRERSTRA